MNMLGKSWWVLIYLLAEDGTKPPKVYNCFINAIGSDANSKDRKFNTFDMFPTTLAAMGCKISGDRLGLGTNLFSGKKTLAETYGYEKVDEELAKRSPFYEKHILKNRKLQQEPFLCQEPM